MKMIVCGLDEVGRGPLAGPIVAAAVILHTSKEHIEKSAQSPVRDSKTLSQLQKNRLVPVIQKHADYGIEVIDVDLINNKGIGWCNKEIFKRLVQKISADSYIIDGNLKIEFSNKCIQSEVKADSRFPEVMCAGILAKAYRDNLMSCHHLSFPQYTWDHNYGYGTKQHIAALKTHGPTIHHRTQFIQKILTK